VVIMKRKILCALLSVIFCVMGIVRLDVVASTDVQSEDIEMSELFTEDALIGYAEKQTWGVYLASGNSVINKISSSKVGAGGTTNAAVRCNVSITSILEKKNASGSWVRVISWTQDNANAFSAGISKSVTVPSGYYYRVRSYHYASTDSATSYTNALWVGN